MEFVKGPDFPTRGIIYNHEDIKNAYATGKGGIVVRGEAEIIAEGSFSVSPNYKDYLERIMAYHEKESPISHIKK